MVLASALAAVSVILAVEVACRVPLLGVVAKLLGSIKKSGRVVSSSRISDHWKEQVLPKYAAMIFAGSFEALFWMVVVFSPVILAAALGEFVGIAVLAVLVSPVGIVFSIVIAAGYHKLRVRALRGRLQ